MRLLEEGNAAYLAFLAASMPVRFVFAIIVMAFVTLLNWMWSLMREQEESEYRRNESGRLLREAELMKLRQQLQPHFLFNSLNSISSLVMRDAAGARRMIQQLSDFLRGTLKKDADKMVSLKEELQQLQLYLEIEKIRFTDRLDVKIEAGAGSMEMKLPPLLLQPILENSIKHGLYGTTGSIVISLMAQAGENELRITVTNPFDGENNVPANGTGFGLSSLNRRLQLLYSRNDLLTVEKGTQVFTTEMRIPQQGSQTMVSGQS
jgi:two-component system, LytTR family, sensor kinase